MKKFLLILTSLVMFVALFCDRKAIADKWPTLEPVTQYPSKPQSTGTGHWPSLPQLFTKVVVKNGERAPITSCNNGRCTYTGYEGQWYKISSKDAYVVFRSGKSVGYFLYENNQPTWISNIDPEFTTIPGS